MRPLKFHYALGLGVNIPIVILVATSIIIASYLLEKVIIDEAINVRLDRNYKWTYFSLIQGHTQTPINAYRIMKQEYVKNFPNISIIRSEKIDELFGKDTNLFTVAGINQDILKKVFEKGEKIIEINKDKEAIFGYYPVKAEIACLICHNNVSKNEILGVIYINISLSKTLETLQVTKSILAITGLTGIIIVSIILYLIYMKIGHSNIAKIKDYLERITNGDLKFKVDDNLLERRDIIGELSQNLKNLQEFLANFTAKILDFSLKLTKQVDKVYHSVDFAQSNIKNLNLGINEIEMKTDEIFRLVNEVSRKMITFNDSLRAFYTSLTENISNSEIKDDLKTSISKIDDINQEMIRLIEKVEESTSREDELVAEFDKIKEIISNFNEILSQINHFVYESLLVSTYLKNLVASIRIEDLEERLFDIFETDLDRYLLRIESHLMDIEKLDPIRWGDPLALSIGKWMQSDEYKKLKDRVKDFDFSEFESNYTKLFNLGKEIITAYDREDYLTVDRSLKNFRALYLLLKASLTELGTIYKEFITS